MNTAQTEAIAQADAHTNNAALPTYSELLAALAKVTNRATRPTSLDSCGRPMVKLTEALVDECRALLARIPA